MKTMKMNISKLKLDDNNARKHSQRNLDSIKRSLEKFGQQKPIVINESSVIIAGNGTFIAAQELGWEAIEVVITTLKDDDQGAFAIADNRIAELASWDYPILAEQLDSLLDKDFDLEIMGWSEHEIEPFLLAEWKPPNIESLDDVIVTKDKSIKFNEKQWETISKTIELLRKDNKTLDDAESLATICLEWYLL